MNYKLAEAPTSTLLEDYLRNSQIMLTEDDTRKSLREAYEAAKKQAAEGGGSLDVKAVDAAYSIKRQMDNLYDNYQMAKVNVESLEREIAKRLALFEPGNNFSFQEATGQQTFIFTLKDGKVTVTH